MAKLPRLLPLIAIAIGGVVAVRAVGAGPGLFQGAQAWAEEAAGAVAEAAGAAPAAETTRVVPAVCALTPEQLAQQAGISPAELRIIQSLSARRTELDARDADFATMLPLMATAEEKLDAKVTALNAIKAEVQAMLGQVDARQQAETDRLIAVYSAMRPREAAAVFATLDDRVLLPIAAGMRPRGLSAVMAQMTPAAAAALTDKLARRFQAQELAARAAAAAANAPAPSAAPAPTQTAATTPAPTTSPAPTQAAATAPAPTTAPAVNRAPQTRPTPRRTSTPPRATPRAPAPTAASATTGPQPYQPSAATTAPPSSPTAPRQSVQ